MIHLNTVILPGSFVYFPQITRPEQQKTKEPYLNEINKYNNWIPINKQTNHPNLAPHTGVELKGTSLTSGI